MPSSGHFLSGLMVCTFLGFCFTGVGLGFISSFTFILLPVSFSLKQPIPSKMSLYSVRSFSTLSDVFTVLILRSFGSFSLPSGSTFSIPSSSRTCLQISGGEFSFDYNEFGVYSSCIVYSDWKFPFDLRFALYGSDFLVAWG